MTAAAGADPRELYRELILDHARAPRNFRRPAGEDVVTTEGINPLCGDRLRLHVALAEGRIRDVGFEGTGCAISMASASLLTEAVRGLDEAAARGRSAQVRALLTGRDEAPAAERESGPETGGHTGPGSSTKASAESPTESPTESSTESTPETETAPEMEKLRALAGVRAYPTRVKCATLAWRALDAALGGGGARVTTE